MLTTPSPSLAAYVSLTPPCATLTNLPPQFVKPEMAQLLSDLRQICAIGYVGGSDLAKQQEQLGTSEIPVTSLFDFCFAENGLTAFKLGKPLASHSFIKWLGEERYKECVCHLLDVMRVWRREMSISGMMRSIRFGRSLLLF
jgi:hypothetical protein